MNPEPDPTPPCPSCGKPLEEALDLPGLSARGPARASRIQGGIPTSEEMESTARTHAERTAVRARRRHGPVRCRACGDAVYRMGDRALPHRLPSLILPMNVAAARLRNHLRRLAIVRVGRIDGDCYLVPFYRVEGRTPDGEESFTLLAASLGEPRLERPFLPPADYRPFGEPAPGAAGVSGTRHAALRTLRPTLDPEEAASRARRFDWRVTRTVELFHYPFWLMRVEDCGRTEGAWVDGVEARLIHHRLRLAPPVPGRRARALMTALPAAASAGVAAAWPALGIPVAVAAWAAGAPLLYASLLRRWRG